MNKPFTIQVQEVEQEIVNTINNSNLPAYVLKQIVKDIYQQISDVEQQEIQKYLENKELENSSFSNKKKGDKK